MGQPQEVGVGRVARLAGGPYGQAVGLAVADHLLTPGELGDELRVPPGGVDPEPGGEHVGRELEAHLVVSAPGGPVYEHADVERSKLREYRTDGDGSRNAGRVPVAALVAGLGLDDLQAGLRKRVLAGDDTGRLGAAAQHPVGHGG